MKIFGICALVGGAVFAAAVLQMGALRNNPAPGPDPAPAAAPAPVVVKEKKLKFPDGLAPTTRAQAVDKAAPYTPSFEPHKLTFLSVNGTLHEWHDGIPAIWQADYVEETELVVVVGRHRSERIQHVTYANGAPPIDRVRWDLEVSVVEAKTGKVLDNRVFQNLPRPVRASEPWALTLIGRQVHWAPVFHWVSENSKIGFPHGDNPYPIVTPDVD
jgi:hypothetical protein